MYLRFFIFFLLTPFFLKAQNDSRVLRVQTGHEKAILSLALHSEKHLLASGGMDNQIHIWDFKNYRELFTLDAHQGDVTCLKFHPSQAILASGGKDGKLLIWDLDTKEVIHSIGHPGFKITDLVFNPRDSSIIGVIPGKGIHIYDLPSGELKKVLDRSNAVQSICIDSKGLNLYGGGEEKEIIIWRLDTYSIRSQLAKTDYPIFDLDLGLGDSLLLSAGGSRFEDRGEVKVWQVSTGTLKANLEGHRTEVQQAQLSPDNLNVVSAGGSELNSELKYWNIGNQVLVRDFNEQKFRVRAVLLNPDATKIISAGGSNRSNQVELNIWDTESGLLLKQLDRLSSPITKLCFSPDEKQIAGAHLDGIISLWDLKKGNLSQVLETKQGEIISLAIDAQSKYLISAAKSGKNTLWRLEDGQKIQEWETAYAYRSLAFHPSKSEFIAAGVSDIYQGKIEGDTIQFLDTLKNAHDLFIYDLRFSKDAQSFLSASYDQSLKKWSYFKKKPLKNFSHPSQVLSADWQKQSGDLVSLSFDGKIRVWNRFGVPQAFPEFKDFKLLKIRFHPLRSELFGIGESDEIVQWSFPQRKILKKWKAHQGQVQDIVLSSGGKFLASGGKDGVIHLWKLEIPGERLSLIHRKDSLEDYLIICSDGYYRSQGQGRESVHYLSEQGSQELDESFNQPERIQKWFEE